MNELIKQLKIIWEKGGKSKEVLQTYINEELDIRDYNSLPGDWSRNKAKLLIAEFEL